MIQQKPFKEYETDLFIQLNLPNNTVFVSVNKVKVGFKNIN